jgi:hypothetical protein
MILWCLARSHLCASHESDPQHPRASAHRRRGLCRRNLCVIDIFRTLGEKSMLILNAVEKRSVVPFFQPIINVATGEVEAIEVLSRIRMEDGSYVIAEEYVSIAEKMGVMHKLDFIQLEKALEAVEETGYSGYQFINMSPRALVLNDFPGNAAHREPLQDRSDAPGVRGHRTRNHQEHGAAGTLHRHPAWPRASTWRRASISTGRIYPWPR